MYAKKKILVIIALAAVFFMISSASATTLMKTNEEDKADSIYVDPDLYLTKEEHLSFLQDAVDNAEDPEAIYFMNEMITLLTDENKGFVDSEDAISILKTMDLGNYNKQALHVFKPFYSSGPGTCKPIFSSAMFPLPDYPILPRYVEWNGEKKILTQAVTTIGLFREHPLFEYKGKHEAYGLADYFSLNADTDGNSYDIDGICFFIIIRYDWSPFGESGHTKEISHNVLKSLMEKFPILSKLSIFE